MSLPLKCPLCNSNSKYIVVQTSHVYGKNDGAFFKCENCKVIFQYPFLTEREEVNFYKEEFEKFMSDRVGKKSNWTNVKKHLDENKETYRRRFNYLKKFLPKRKIDVLEVGCSSGFMLFPLMRKGYSCYGIEPSGYFRNFLIQNKVNMFDDIKKIKNKKFDLILHFFVLEHIRYPISFLKQQLKLLKKNGKIIFEIPCYSEALVNVYDIPEFERFYWSKAHPWYFNRSSINYLLKKLNKKFSVAFDQRYNLSNHIYWSLKREPGGQNFYTKFLGRKLENLYKNELVKKGFADTLICTIYK